MKKETTYNPVGRLQIWKVFNDRDKDKELVWDEHNVITSGMGVGLSHLFSASAAKPALPVSRCPSRAA